MGKSNRILWLIILITIFYQCSNSSLFDGKVTGDSNVEKIPDVVLYNFSYRFTDGGKLVWILYSKKADMFLDEQITKVKEVHLIFYKDNQEDSVIDSKYGEVNEKERILSAISNVILKTSDDTKLYTDILFWDDKRAKLYTDAPVKIIKPNNSIIEGIGMDADKNLERLVIKHNVKGQVYEKK